MVINLVKIFFPAALSFFIGILITPILTHYFYKYKMWKRAPRTDADQMAKDFKKIHSPERTLHGELSTPRIGGVIIWLSALLTILTIFMISKIFPSEIAGKMNFFSRSQTLLPLAALISASLVGLADDLFQIYGRGGHSKDDVVYRWVKILLIIGIGLAIVFWFYYKLGVSSIGIPFGGELNLGLLFIPFFILVMLAVFSGGVIDGIDGLAGGVLASIFSSYTVIAFARNQIDLAAFSAVITGAILVFLWFNIPPARFYMGETGMMGLTVLLSVIAFLTNSVLILPIIAFPLAITSLSAIIQLISKKFRHGKKVFRVAPLHYHFEAIGWSPYKVTMRFWIISMVFAIIGAILAIISIN